jgi:hypothetical protein
VSYETVQLVQMFQEDIHVQHVVHARISLHLQKAENQTKDGILTLSSTDQGRQEIYMYIYIHRVSQEECAKFREGVPYVKVYRYNPKHLCPKLNGYRDNGQKKSVVFLGVPHTVPDS